MKNNKIEVFVRHCFYSTASSHKKRPAGFSHRACHDNLMATADLDQVNFTFLLDTHYRKEGQKHFIEEQTNHPVVEINAGCEGNAFLALLDHVLSLPLDEETIIYFLEDDYLHRPNWANYLKEAFTLPNADYVTLYDHRDKYDQSLYADLYAKLFVTPSAHWRTTCSTTNTYAMRLKTLKKHLKIHKKYSQGYEISKDHEKFLHLGRKGATLLSPIPGVSTHGETLYMSPCVDWDFPFSCEVVY